MALFFVQKGKNFYNESVTIQEMNGSIKRKSVSERFRIRNLALTLKKKIVILKV